MDELIGQPGPAGTLLAQSKADWWGKKVQASCSGKVSGNPTQPGSGPVGKAVR